MYLFRLFRDPGAGDSGSGPTLADIDKMDANPKPDAGGGIKPASDDDPPVLDPKPVEGVNADGTLQEGYIKDEAGNVTKDPNFKPADDNAGDDPADADDPANGTEFWKEVDKLRGIDININWEEFKDNDGNQIDPISPEGVLIREKAVIDYALENFETNLKQSDPRGYAYLLHRQLGGTDEEFFNTQSVKLPEYSDFEASADLQASTYKASLMKKGLDIESAQVLVDKAIKDGKLFDQADKAYKDQQAEDAKTLAAVAAKQKADQDTYNAAVSNLNNTLTSTVTEGKGLTMIIPEAERTPFLQYVREHIQYDDKGFVVVQRIEDKNINRVIGSMYLSYKNGDLKQMIQREAKKETVKRLRAAVSASKEPVGGRGDDPGKKANDDGFVPMSQV